MSVLNLTEDEAQTLIRDDEEIDKGKDLFPLTEEQAKAAKKARQADRVINPYGKASKRERKEDETKRYLIALFAAALDGPVEMINPEREFTFVWSGRKFKLTLSAPRK